LSGEQSWAPHVSQDYAAKIGLQSSDLELGKQSFLYVISGIAFRAFMVSEGKFIDLTGPRPFEIISRPALLLPKPPAWLVLISFSHIVVRLRDRSSVKADFVEFPSFLKNEYPLFF